MRQSSRLFSEGRKLVRDGRASQQSKGCSFGAALLQIVGGDQMTNKAIGRALAFGLVAGFMLASLPAQAQSAAEFYRGKTMRMLIGYGPGGGYDLYGRLVAEFLPRHLPGNPTVVPQNMPGAGSFVAAK
jgi:hypothetical protein